jgi:outer membrane receptor protein involved in Fe transport
MMKPSQRTGVALLLWAGLPCAVFASVHVALIDALVALHEKGYQIVYSNDLVTSSMHIDVDEIDFGHVQAALPELGLKFVANGDMWLIIRDPAAASHKHAQVVAAAPHARSEGIETLIVTGSRHLMPSGLSSASSTTVTSTDMNATPALAGDVMRVTNRLPGMSSVGISAKPLVRGGVDDETLVLVDGVEMLDPYHLADFQNIFSSVDDRTVDRIDVYTGGFPARFGNRMSGVMAISTLAPDAPPRTELGLSLLSTFANTRGNSSDGDTSWLASARHGNLELLVDWVDKSYGSPKYDDAYARLGRRLSSNVTVYGGVHWSRDDVSLTNDEEVARSDINTTYLWTRLDVAHGDDLRSSTLLTYVSSDREKSERNTDPKVSVGTLDYSQEMRKGALRSDFTYNADTTLMEFGIEGAFADSHYQSTALVDRGPIAPLFGNPRIDAFDIDTSPSGWSGGAYWSGEFLLGDRFAVQPGLRWDFQDYYESGMDAKLSPRLGLRYQLTDATTLRASIGRYFQPEGIHEMKATDGVDHFFAPQLADHLIGSVDWSPDTFIKVRAEGYYKSYQPTRTRFENLFNAFVLLPELEPDRVALTPSRARAIGADLQARFDISPTVSGLLRCSYLNADDRIEGDWVARKWSQHYTAQTMLAWQGEASSASAALTWHSGWRTTQVPASVPIGTVLPLASILNNGTLPDYWSLDVSFSRTWHLGRASVTARADVTNVFNHDNVVGIDYTARESATDVLLRPNSQSLLPWVPSVGIIVAF